jgi:hypothetical protein
VFALDPPPVAAGEFLAGLPGDGLAHLGWGPAEEEVARAALAARQDVRATVKAVYRALRDACPATPAALEQGFARIGQRADCALAVRALAELGLAGVDGDVVRLLDPRPTQLDDSAAYRAQVAWIQAAGGVLGAPAARIAA